MREKVGLIFGTVGSTRFRLGVQDARLRRGDYVQVKHETDGWVVGQVFDITRESSLSLEEVARSAVPGARDERLSAEVLVIGYRDRRGYVQPPRTPFRPGETVFRADEGLLAEVLGLAGVQGAYVGMIKGHDVRVELEINGLVQKHVSVLAKTGAGKSYVVGVLMEELLKRNVPLVVVDPHGEHSSLSSPNKEGADHGALRRFGVKPRGYAEQVIEYSPDTQVNPNAVRLTLDGTNLDARELSELVGAKLSNAQAGLLHQAVRKLSERGRDYALDDIVEEVRRNQSALKWNLISALEYLQDLRLFDEVGTPITALVKRGQATVVNLRGSAPDIQDIVVSRLTRSLFEERKRNRIPPCMLVVEEAHHFCPERTFGAALAGDILRTVASEGRKFGLGLCVVTQRPAKVDKNVLSQCNTQFVLKVTNPNDLKAIVASVEGLGTEWEDELQRLPVGVAIVTSPSVAVPLFVEIRPRETKHGGRSVEILERDEDKEERDGQGERRETGERTDADEVDAGFPEDDAGQPFLGEDETGIPEEGPPEPAPSPARAMPPSPAIPASAPVPSSAHVPALGEVAEVLRLVRARPLESLPKVKLESLRDELVDLREGLAHYADSSETRRLSRDLSTEIQKIETLLSGPERGGFLTRFLPRGRE